MTPSMSNIKSGFRATALFPLDPNAIAEDAFKPSTDLVYYYLNKEIARHPLTHYHDKLRKNHKDNLEQHRFTSGENNSTA